MMNARQAVILAALEDIHFVATARPIKSAWPMLRLPEQVHAGLKIDPLRIAAAVGPNLRASIRTTPEWIIIRHSAIVIQTQNLSTQRIQLLSNLPVSRVADGHVKLP